jgi:hypothetical protein
MKGEKHGYGGRPREKTDQADPEESDPTSRVAALEKKIAALEANAPGGNLGGIETR